jgi:hypothetical protein
MLARNHASLNHCMIFRQTPKSYLTSLVTLKWFGILYSVWRLAAGWRVRGSNTGRDRDFLHPSRPAMGPTQLSVKWVLGVFHGGNTAGEWLWSPTPSSTEVKERVELYVYSPAMPSWNVMEWNLFLSARRPFLIYLNILRCERHYATWTGLGLSHCGQLHEA